jgi:hypothetical protein
MVMLLVWVFQAQSRRCQQEMLLQQQSLHPQQVLQLLHNLVLGFQIHSHLLIPCH